MWIYTVIFKIWPHPFKLRHSSNQLSKKRRPTILDIIQGAVRKMQSAHADTGCVAPSALTSTHSTAHCTLHTPPVSNLIWIIWHAAIHCRLGQQTERLATRPGCADDFVRLKSHIETLKLIFLEVLLPCWGVSGAGTYPPRYTLETKTNERWDGAISPNAIMKALWICHSGWYMCPGQDEPRRPVDIRVDHMGGT